MKTRLIVPLLLGAVLYSLPVLANNVVITNGPDSGYWRERAEPAMDPATKCRLLNERFEAILGRHEAALKAPEAKSLWHQGLKLCARDRQQQGVEKLESALRDVGVQPWG